MKEILQTEAFQTEAFQIEAFVNSGKYHGLRNGIEYLQTNGINTQNGTIFLGRALTNLTNRDTLFTKNNVPIRINGFHLYGHETGFVSAACICVMLCSDINDEIAVGDILTTK